MRRLLLGLCLLLLLLLGGCRKDPPPEPVPPVGLLYSAETIQALGWRAEWEWKGAQTALQRLGADFAVLKPEELADWGGELLVLPNIRNMHPDTVAAIKRLAEENQVKVLATYMTSYRQHDNASWEPNNFALSSLFAADFHRWVGAPPQADSLQLGQQLGGDRVPLGRHQAMLVRPLAQAQVLATWDDTDEAAIVLGPAGIYVGEDLFAPENSDSSQVLALLVALLEQLRPGTAKVPSEMPKIQAVEPPFVALPAAGRRLRIGLGAVQEPLLLRAPEGLLANGEEAELVRLAPREDGLTVFIEQGSELEQPLTVKGDPYVEILQLRSNGSYSWSAYRGQLEVVPGKPAQLVNLVDVEDYLAGVVPSEVPAYFPGETLRAMAIVARTFVLSHLGRHQGFDVCNQVHCQVYRGLSKEAESTNSAIKSTTGTTLVYNGKPADTTFHAVCGGVGADNQSVWPKASQLPYLKGWFDIDEGQFQSLADESAVKAFIDSPPTAYCSGSGRFRWRETYAWPELEKKLSEGLKGEFGPEFSGLVDLKEVKVSERTSLGRVAELSITDAHETYRVRADKIRWLFSGGRIGPGGLQSTLFYLEREGDTLQVVGGGWGHGVGLCQEGAGGRARAGQKAGEILQHYYPGTALEQP